MTENKRTPLFDWHVSQSATFSVFHGWDMPLWYSAGAKKEHISAIITAGMFDTSHMGAIAISGRDAFDLLQRCFSKDLRTCLEGGKAPLRSGRCVYGVFLNERGETIDDAILYQLKKEHYLLAVNSGMSPAVAGHLRRYSEGRAVDVTDITDQMAKIDLQGPKSARILAKILQQHDSVLSDMVYFSFKGGFEDSSGFSGIPVSGGQEIMVSRTGYTGEIGFELLVNPSDALPVWETLLAAGKDDNLLFCGLAARDSLRAGALLPLSQQDIGPWPYINHPWQFTLPFNAEKSRFTKQFIGDVVLQLRDTADYTLAFAGYDPRKVSVQDAVVLDANGERIGAVLTCVADLAIGRVDNRIYSLASPDKPEGFNPLGLCCGFVKVHDRLPPGARVTLQDKRRKIPADVVADIRPNRTARRPMRDFL
jgi:aminomethyltransferase